MEESICTHTVRESVLQGVRELVSAGTKERKYQEERKLRRTAAASQQLEVTKLNSIPTAKTRF